VKSRKLRARDAAQELTVRLHEGAWRGGVGVSDDEHATPPSEDAFGLGAGTNRVEVVEGVARDDDVDARVRQRGGFGGACQTDELPSLERKSPRGHRPHAFIRLDTNDAVPAIENPAGQHPRAGADVRDDLGTLELNRGERGGDDVRWIVRAIARVLLGFAGEEIGGAHETN